MKYPIKTYQAALIIELVEKQYLMLDMQIVIEFQREERNVQEVRQMQTHVHTKQLPTDVHSSTIHKNQNPKQLKSSKTDEWKNKMFLLTPFN